METQTDICPYDRFESDDRGTALTDIEKEDADEH